MLKKLPRVSKKGFVLAGKRDVAHVLLFHGYTGSPYDLRPAADFLHQFNFRVSVPLLKGHGKKPSDLFDVSAKDWIEESESLFKDFDQNQPIIVGGLSMGALLALLLACGHKNIKALILFSPALRLGWLAHLTVLSLNLGLLDKKRSPQKPSGGSDIFDPDARLKTPAYKEMPLSGLLEFERLRALAIENLSQVSCPLFIAFGKHDATIDIYGSHRLLLEETAQPLVSKFYSNSKHVITLDYDREKIFNDMLMFINHHLKM